MSYLDEVGAPENANVYNTEFELLQSQEQWLVKTLKQIAEQRNSLQVEKLQLKHILSNLQKGVVDKPKPEPSTSKEFVSTNDEAKELLMTIEEMEAELPDELQLPNMSINRKFLCNQQELNLNVEYPLLSYDEADNCFEEDDSDSDLNYFLNGPREKGYEYTQPVFKNKNEIM